jgi:hypothetical protein
MYSSLRSHNRVVHEGPPTWLANDSGLCIASVDPRGDGDVIAVRPYAAVKRLTFGRRAGLRANRRLDRRMDRRYDVPMTQAALRTVPVRIVSEITGADVRSVERWRTAPLPAGLASSSGSMT